MDLFYGPSATYYLHVVVFLTERDTVDNRSPAQARIHYTLGVMVVQYARFCTFPDPLKDPKNGTP